MARSELQKRSGRPAACLSTLAAAEPAGQIVHEGGRRMRQGSEINVSLSLAARAFNFEPRVATIHRLIDGGDGSIGSPSAHILSFQLSQKSLSACRMRASPLVRASSDCAERIAVIARALPSSFLKVFRSPPDRGVGWCFGAMRSELRLKRKHQDVSNDGQQPSSS